MNYMQEISKLASHVANIFDQTADFEESVTKKAIDEITKISQIWKILVKHETTSISISFLGRKTINWTSKVTELYTKKDLSECTLIPTTLSKGSSYYTFSNEDPSTIDVNHYYYLIYTWFNELYKSASYTIDKMKRNENIAFYDEDLEKKLKTILIDLKDCVSIISKKVDGELKLTKYGFITRYFSYIRDWFYNFFYFPKITGCNDLITKVSFFGGLLMRDILDIEKKVRKLQYLVDLS